MHCRFQILLRWVLGVVRKSGGGGPLFLYFIFIAFFDRILKYFEGVHEVPPPLRVHLCLTLTLLFQNGSCPMVGPRLRPASSLRDAQGKRSGSTGRPGRLPEQADR